MPLSRRQKFVKRIEQANNLLNRIDIYINDIRDYLKNSYSNYNINKIVKLQKKLSTKMLVLEFEVKK